MHQCALLDLHDQNARIPRHQQALGQDRQLGVDAVGAHLDDEFLQCVDLPAFQPLQFACVRHAEDHRPADGVAEGGQLVGDGLPPGGCDSLPGEFHLLELHAAVFAKRELPQ